MQEGCESTRIVGYVSAFDAAQAVILTGWVNQDRNLFAGQDLMLIIDL